MNKKQWMGWAMGLLLFGISGVAQAAFVPVTTLDFANGVYSEPWGSDFGVGWHTYTEQGFTFTTAQHLHDDLQMDLGWGYSHTDAADGVPTWVATLGNGGKSFSLLGFDYAGTGEIAVQAGSVGGRYTLNDDLVTLDSLHTAGDLFRDVTQVTFILTPGSYEMGEFFFDNFKVAATPTPEPTSMLLFGTGVAVFLGAGRKKQA